MASESSGRTFQEYLEHHLQNLVFGPLPEAMKESFTPKAKLCLKKKFTVKIKIWTLMVKSTAKKHYHKTVGT